MWVLLLEKSGTFVYPFVLAEVRNGVIVHNIKADGMIFKYFGWA